MASDIVSLEVQPFERSAPRALAFAVGFFFSFRLAIVLLSVHILGVEPSTGSALSIGLDLLLLSLVCFDTVGAGQRTIRSFLRLPAIRWTAVFLAFSCCSFAWSESASLANSFAYWLGLAIDAASVVMLLKSSANIDVAIAIMRGFIWSSCLLAVLAWLMPASADLRLGDMEFFNTNEIGNLCAFGLLFSQYLTRSTGVKWNLAKFTLVITLVRTLSKATLVAFLVCESFLLILDRSMNRKTKALLLASAFVVVLVFWGLFEAYYDIYTTAGNQAETLTGRIAIWMYVLGAIQNHPWNLWIGHGFDSWWKVVPPFGNELFEARHAENEILQQFYAYGVAGLVILTCIYGSLFREILRLKRSSAKALLLCMVIFVLVRGLAEADAFDLLLPLWSIVLLSVLIEHERMRRESNPGIPTNARNERLGA